MIMQIVSWFVFFVAHSALAATPVKSYFEQQIGSQTYRLLYNLVSLLLLSIVLYYIVYGDKTPVFQCIIFICLLGCALIFMGLYIINKAFEQIQIGSFLGFKKVEMESNGLITEGIYAVVRHPLYWGISLGLVGLFLLIPYYSILISMIMGILYMAIGIEFEEKKLRATFGGKYIKYCIRKKKFLPFLY